MCDGNQTANYWNVLKRFILSPHSPHFSCTGWLFVKDFKRKLFVPFIIVAYTLSALPHFPHATSLSNWMAGWLASRPKALGPSGCECKFCILLRSTHLVFDGWLYVVGWLNVRGTRASLVGGWMKWQNYLSSSSATSFWVLCTVRSCRPTQFGRLLYLI